MEYIHLKINGKEITTQAGSTILDVARENGIVIPTLCYLKEINKIGACRMCLVEVKGSKGLPAACMTVVTEGMEVYTDSEQVMTARKKNLELRAFEHRFDCTNCDRDGRCELRNLCKEYEVDVELYGEGPWNKDIVENSMHLVRDNSKCVKCRRCVAECQYMQIGITSILGRGYKTAIGYPIPLKDSNCIACGACIANCPTAALTVKEHTNSIWKAIIRPEVRVVAVVSKNAFAEFEKAMEDLIEIDSRDKMVSIMHKIGFDKVYLLEDVMCNIMEELKKSEYQKRKNNGGSVPIISADDPSIERFIRNKYPKLISHLSDLKTPANQFASLYKKPGDFIVSISTNTSEKIIENPDVDAAVTVKELAKMIKRACVSKYTLRKVWQDLDGEQSDDCMKITFEKTEINISVNTVIGATDCIKVLDSIIEGSNNYDYLELRTIRMD